MKKAAICFWGGKQKRIRKKGLGRRLKSRLGFNGWGAFNVPSWEETNKVASYYQTIPIKSVIQRVIRDILGEKAVNRKVIFYLGC